MIFLHNAKLSSNDNLDPAAHYFPGESLAYDERADYFVDKREIS